ncbi:MAG: 30S ribosomal protein S9 [Caldisericia bacterium]|nr:30S ribosomal protein S9 [Caldisericia bacterium]MDD4613976.1 30S ribosomal protein S9 [Caldisericia bacterium]
MASHPILSTGYRKTSIARIVLKPGSGKFRVNGKDMKDYFISDLQQKRLMSVFHIGKKENQFDIRVKVHGGGSSSQVAACRHGIAQAIVDFDPDTRSMYRDRGFLTRDLRIKERAKAGLRGARKDRQYRKR